MSQKNTVGYKYEIYMLILIAYYVFHLESNPSRCMYQSTSNKNQPTTLLS